MSGDDNARLLYALLALMLVASSLLARRLPIGQLLKLALGWCAIFAVVFVLFSFRHEAGQVWARMKSEVSPGGSTAADGTLRIRARDDGHYWVAASVNGQSVDFMVDSGATITTMSASAAEAAGVAVDTDGFPVITQTANGMAEARRARIATLKVGPIVREEFPVHVAARLGDTNLLGMNFLSTLKGWRIEGNEMVLNP